MELVELASWLAGPAGGLITCLWLFQKFLNYQEKQLDKLIEEMQADRAMFKDAINKMDSRLSIVEIGVNDIKTHLLRGRKDE